MKTEYRTTRIHPTKGREVHTYLTEEEARAKYDYFSTHDKAPDTEIFLTKNEVDGNMTVSSSLARAKFLRGKWAPYQPQRVKTILERLLGGK